MEKKCPFNNEVCNEQCELYIAFDELNESLAARLSSLGVITRGKGSCAFKTIAMSNARRIYENTSTSAKRI